MSQYQFKGVNEKGQNVRGKIEAENEFSAKQQIKNLKITLISIRDTSQPLHTGFQFSSKTVDTKTLSIITRNLSTMLKSGIPLVDALDTLKQQTTHPTMMQALSQIKESVKEGQSFYKSLKPFSSIFNRTYISMCEAGEVSGTLDVVLLRLAEFIEAQSELQSKVRSALIYPALMTVFSFFMVIFLLTYVVPKVRVLFEENTKITLPWYSQALFALSDLFIQYWIAMLFATVIFGLCIWKWKKSKKGQTAWDYISLKLPIFGQLIRAVAISRFSRTLSTLLKGGVPIIEALEIVKNVVNNQKIQKIIEYAKQNIITGNSLSAPLIQSKEFPPMMTQMIRVGEKTGQLEGMLTKISDSYDKQVKTEVETLTSLLEPVMLIVMGGVIAFIVFSTLIPLLQVYNIEGIAG